MRRTVIGQTGRRPLLSDDAINRKAAKGKTVHFQYERMSGYTLPNGKVKYRWKAWVCGPFHSRTYGCSGYGTTKEKAKAELKSNLEDYHSYFGHMILSGIDQAEKGERRLDVT